MRTLWGAALAASLFAAGTVPAAPLEPGEYKIGFVSEVTGPIAFAGASFLHGAQLAVEEINAGGSLGKGAMIGLVDKDSGSDAARSIQNVNQFLADRSVVAVSCCVLSPVANSVKPITINAKIPLIIYGATMAGLP